MATRTTATNPAAGDPGAADTAPSHGTTAIMVIPIETPALGDRSYLAHDGEVAFVTDPQRDIDRVLALLGEHRLRLTHVFESHIHNDYVTGGLAARAPACRPAGASWPCSAP